ncbi:MAG: sulfurtransferase TusA family protein [Candidatus Omnitrophica bacterium]|nr:sulfurtransferase TusA family protein [Candidatus Omnitrophota bacterium]
MAEPDIRVNYKGVACPYNYVKAKLVLEEMKMGRILEVVVDDGEPARHVPKSLERDGQTILESFKDENGLVHIVIQKTAEY